MKTSLWIIVVVLVAILSFLVGYGLAPRQINIAGAPTATGKVAGYGAQAGGYGAPATGGYGAPSGGYGAPSAGGYGAPAGGYGAPPAGGYGAPPAGGYGAPPR